MSIQNCPGFIYTVQRGDTMFRLAQRYGITLEQLIAANPQVSDPNRLTIGQQLCIPTGVPQPGPVPPCPNGTLYTVRQGDTMYLIAQRNNISLAALIAANPQVTDPNVIQIGQQLCIPGVGPTPPECVGGTLYTIQAGDTLYSLAIRFNTTVDAIIAANPGIDPLNLQIGQRICIPQPTPSTCTGQLYTVVAGDTMFSIAQRFGVSLQALIAANPQIADPNQIFPGQIICIPAVTPPQCVGGTLHTIRPGDTLFSLAAFYGTTVNAIIAANPGIDPQNLVVGQTICIPLPQPVSCTGQLYTVVAGDTMSSIATRFGVSLQALIAANPQITDPNRIFPGQIICIPAVTPPQCVGGTLHTIRPGDTLFNLAAFYGTTVNAIIAANPGIDPQNLVVGQTICIPLPQPAQCSGELYTVKSGDSLFSIANRFGVTVEMLIAANPQIVDPSRIFPGQIICIPRAMPEPDEVSFMLNPTRYAPEGASARATLNYSKGTATVKAMGMPYPHMGRCYMAWLVMMHGMPMKAVMSRSGVGEYAAMIGPMHNLHDVMRVLVTHEPSTAEHPSEMPLFTGNVPDKKYR